MKRLYMVVLVSSLLMFFVLFTVTSLFAEDSDISRRTLKGLTGVYVIVEDIQPNLLKYEKYARKFGLNKADIRKNVERRLTAAGLRVFSREEWQQTPGRPVFYLSLNTHEGEKYWFSYDIKIALRQIVLLETDPAVKTLAGTWVLNMTGMTNIGNLNLISDDIDVLIARFTLAYKNSKGGPAASQAK